MHKRAAKNKVTELFLRLILSLEPLSLLLVLL